MATGDQSKMRKQRYLPQNRPAKKKGAYPLKPWVQGFFISCDGGRDHQASQEALNAIDSFFEELMHGTDSKVNPGLFDKPINKKVTFSYSEDEDDEEDEGDDGEEEKNKGDGDKTEVSEGGDNQVNEKEVASEGSSEAKQLVENEAEMDKEDEEKQKNGVDEPPRKKTCMEEANPSAKVNENAEKSIDRLIEAELKELLGDKSKRRFMKLDPGCNGLVFIQMKRRDGDPSPKDIAQHAMTSAAATKICISLPRFQYVYLSFTILAVCCVVWSACKHGP